MSDVGHEHERRVEQRRRAPARSAGRSRAALGRRSIVLVGMMGAGKSSIGRRLAARLGIPFVDADTEIEKAAGMTIPEIFATHGEAYFRAGEARVIARLLESGPQVLATGGGAFMNARHARADPRQGHLGLAQGRLRRADAAGQAARRPAAAQDRRSGGDAAAADRRALSDLCARPTSPCSRATCRTRRSSTRSSTALRGRHRAVGAAPEAARTMTAPLRAGEPITVTVALGERAYDIVIGRGLLATLGARIARLRPGAQGRDRHRRDRGAAIISRRRKQRCRRRHRASRRSIVPPGEGSKSFAHASSRSATSCIAAQHRARRSRGRARRRRGRRSRRLCRRAGAARHRLRAGADDAAGAGRFLGRRQDRHQLARRARTWSAPSISRSWCSPTPRCSTRCRRASSAPAMPRSRNTACSATPASSPGWKRTGATCSPAGPAREHAIAVSCRAKADDRRARRARDRRPRAAQSRPHLRPCA